MKNYLLLRLKLLGRELVEVGWLRLLLLGPMLLAALLEALRLTAKMPPSQWLLPFVGAGMCWAIHRQRPDLAFLHGAAPNSRRWLLAEYTLLQLPIVGVLLARGAWLPAALALALVPLITHTSGWRPTLPARKKTNSWRSEAFEWVSGYRKTGAWLIWLLGFGVAAWQRHSTGAALVPIVWTLVVSFFYFTPEDPLMLLQYPGRSGGFLRRKLGLALGFYLLTSLPFAVLLGTGAVTWGGVLALLLWGSLVLTMVILAKYAFYPHAEPMQAGVIGLALLVAVNSVYVALLAAAGGGLIWKSRRHLRQYRWHD